MALIFLGPTHVQLLKTISENYKKATISCTIMVREGIVSVPTLCVPWFSSDEARGAFSSANAAVHKFLVVSFNKGRVMECMAGCICGLQRGKNELAEGMIPS